VNRVATYSLYERIWHWLQALAIITMLITGLEIHAPERLHLFGFQRAVRVHEIVALLTVANAFLSLFYHLSTGALRKFVPEPKDYFSLALAQARYYAYGILRGAPHPVRGARHTRFNPLQQVTYILILNVLLPLQVITGILVWWAPSWPETIRRLGGLAAISYVHAMIAWLFAAFIIVHVYLSTTGSKLGTYFKSMIFGWEELDDGKQGAPKKAVKVPLPEPNGTLAASSHKP